MTDAPAPPASGSEAPLGFVGLGMMGSEITTRPLRSGHRVVVYNRTAEKSSFLASIEVAPQCT